MLFLSSKESARFLISKGRLEDAKRSAETMLGGPLPEVLSDIHHQHLESQKIEKSNEEGETISRIPSNQQENRHRKRIFGMTYFRRTFGLSFFSYCWGMANFGW